MAVLGEWFHLAGGPASNGVFVGDGHLCGAGRLFSLYLYYEEGNMTAPVVPTISLLAVVLVAALVWEFRLRRALQKLVSQILQRERSAEVTRLRAAALMAIAVLTAAGCTTPPDAHLAEMMREHANGMSSIVR